MGIGLEDHRPEDASRRFLKIQVRLISVHVPFVGTDISIARLSIERSRNLAGGNSKRRWHGTIRACRLGDDESQKTLCVNLGCSLCRIIEVHLYSPP